LVRWFDPSNEHIGRIGDPDPTRGGLAVESIPIGGRC
jgi:hypothetical protein